MSPQDASISSANCLSEERSREFEWRVDIDHPVLRDHFPGTPIVPAFMQLEAVRAASEALLGGTLAEVRFRAVKFLAPLLPEQSARISLTRSESGRGVSFSMTVNGALLTKGELLAT